MGQRGTTYPLVSVRWKHLIQGPAPAACSATGGSHLPWERFRGAPISQSLAFYLSLSCDGTWWPSRPCALLVIYRTGIKILAMSTNPLPRVVIPTSIMSDTKVAELAVSENCLPIVEMCSIDRHLRGRCFPRRVLPVLYSAGVQSFWMKGKDNPWSWCGEGTLHKTFLPPN